MKDRFIKSFDGAKIHYFLRKGKKTPIVFMHGITGGYSGWGLTYPYFQKRGHTVLCMDLRGHGYSDKSKKLSIENAAKDLQHILGKEGIKKAIFVGHCYGGAVLMSLYMRDPSLFKNLVLISYHLDPKKDSNVQIFGRAYLLLLRSLRLVYKKDYFTAANFKSFRPLKDLDWPVIFKLVKIASPKTVSIYVNEFNNYEGKKIASKIKVPTLIIQGTNDILVKKHYSEELSKVISNSKLVLLEKMNHNPIINCPKVVNGILCDFIESPSSQSL